MEKGLSYSGPDAGLAVVAALSSMTQQSATDGLGSCGAAIALRSSQARCPIRFTLAIDVWIRSLADCATAGAIKVEYDVLNFDAQNFTHRLRLTREYADHEDVRSDFASSTQSSPVIAVGQGSITTPPPADMSAMRTLATAAQTTTKGSCGFE